MNLAPAPARSPEGGDRERAEGARQYLTFALEHHHYAVPLEQVVEISPNRPLNRMPHMPKGVEGLLDLRGSVLPVVNLRSRLGLPPQDPALAENILILSVEGTPVGMLVDKVDSVLTAQPEQHARASALLAGPDGCWVSGFLLLGERVVVLLETERMIASSSGRAAKAQAATKTLERQLDDDLRQLIAMAPKKSEAESARIIPQMEAAISHTEEEMGKVISRVEAMLSAADLSFQSLARLKQEVQLGHLKGQEFLVVEMERNAQALQDAIFEVLQRIQFQDIARQKLERVLNHVRGLQVAIGQKLRDTGLHRS